jgi:site-specific DNA-methyltransferase (adenine-specific)
VIPYYEHTGITIYHGDCREWFHTAAPKSLGLVATDPPYGVGIEYASYKDDLQTTTSLVLRFVEMAEPVARCIAFSVGKFDTELALYQKRPPRWRMCWYKGAQTTASPIGFNDWEAVMVYGDNVHNYAHDWFYAQPERMGAFGHPCPKPLLFARTLIARLAKPGEIICDPFAGSGTTLRAAKDMGHPAIGIEIEEKYCEIAARRLQQEALPLDVA